MAEITEAQALSLVSLDSMKIELRIPISEVSHDALITSQLVAAVNFVARSTGLPLADLPPLRPAIIAAVRSLYDGYRELGPLSSVYGWMQPFRSYKAD